MSLDAFSSFHLRGFAESLPREVAKGGGLRDNRFSQRRATMAEQFQYDVFLSHNQADKPRVRRLTERFCAASGRAPALWFDEWIIQPGDVPSPVGRERVAEGRVRDRALAIERGLEASRTPVLCLSPAALGSDWVGLERSTFGRGNLPFRDPANAGRRFISLHPSAPHRLSPEKTH